MQQAYSFSSGLKNIFAPLPTPQTEVDARLLRETQKQFVRLIFPMAVVNMVNATAVAVAYIGFVDSWRIISWYGVMLVFASLQVMTSQRFRKTEMPAIVSGKMLRKAELLSLILGVLWGSVALLFATEILLGNLFLNVIVVGMGAGTVAMLGPICRVSLRFLIGSIPTLFIANFIYAYPFSLQTLLLVTTLILALIIGASRNAFHLREMVSREVDADVASRQMIDAIESTNDAFAFFNKGGELILANEQHKALFGDNAEVLNREDGDTGVETVQCRGRWLMRAKHDTRHGGTVLVHTDISAIKMRERELVEARREAVEADEAKSRFLSTMSHELRTPLNIILGFSRLMASDSRVKLSWGEVAEYSDSINESGTHLLHLIDDIIDYSKVGLDKFSLEPAEVDIRRLLAKAVSLAAGFEDVRSLSDIDVQVSREIGMLRIDESICQRVIINLLSNALRFGGTDNRIVIRAGLNPEGCPFIAVRDFGNGIPENELERVFEAFYQRENGLDRGFGGTGLGLTLCRHLARLHDGDVLLKSRIGVGTTAMFVLPQSTHTSRLSDAPLAISHRNEKVA